MSHRLLRFEIMSCHVLGLEIAVGDAIAVDEGDATHELGEVARRLYRVGMSGAVMTERNRVLG